MRSGAQFKVAVVGSVNFTNYPLMKEVLDRVNPAMIVSGGAVGADTLGQQYAKEAGLTMLIYYPEYAEYGRRAPLRRNIQIANVCDVGVAFPIGESRGTRHCIKNMLRLNKKVYIIECDENSNLVTCSVSQPV